MILICNQNLQGCLEDNGDDTYNATGCKTWCRTGSIRVADAYGVPGIVLSSPHFLYGDDDMWKVRFGLTQPFLRTNLNRFGGCSKTPFWH